MATERKKQQDRERMQRKRAQDAHYTQMLEDRLKQADEVLAKFMDFRNSDYVPNALFDRAEKYLDGK